MGHALGNNYGKAYSFLSKPVELDIKFTVNAADTGGLGVTGVAGQGVANVFMHTSQTPGKGPNGYLNPNPASGLFMIQLAYNYKKYYGLDYRLRSPLTGSALAINGSALTAGQPYQIVSVGSATAGAATIAPVADSSGSLASTWFSLYDAYGNTFIIWFSVSGVGARPNLGTAAADGAQGLHYVQQSIVTSDTAATIGADLVTTIAALPSGISGVFSFTAAGTTTVTVTSTGTGLQLAGPPSDGTVATGFTFALTKYTTNIADWQGVGLPKGIIPLAGVSFIATATGYSTGGGSSGTVKAVSVSGIMAVEVIGNPSNMLAPIPMGGTNGQGAGSPNVGGWIIGQFLAPTPNTTHYDSPMIPTNPADTTVVAMKVYVEQGTVVGGNNE